MREILQQIIQAAIERADPAKAVASAVERRGDTVIVAGAEYDLARFKRVVVLGAGKAAAPMAKAMEDILGSNLDQGFVITKYGHSLDVDRIQVAEAAHPVPDATGQEATELMLDMAWKLGPEDLVFCLLSGGASALLPAPRSGLTLAHKQEITHLLLSCGADIGEVNSVRKHLSRIKGGGLAQALYPATVHTLIISDVIGDRLDVIGSGPTAPDPSTFDECLEVLGRYALLDKLPTPVREVLEAGQGETPKPGDPVLAKVRNTVIASNGDSLRAAAAKAGELGFSPLILTSRLRGEAKEAAKALAAVAEEAALAGDPMEPPLCLLAGGETTVTLQGGMESAGKGGRNQEMALALALALAESPESRERIAVACVGTDGTDGPTDAAGALVFPDTLARAASQGLDPKAALAAHDAYPFFAGLGDLVITGPTRTNVMDVAALLVK